MKNSSTLRISGIIINTIILGLAGSLFHMLFKLTGESTAAGIISPVNESIWEHLKIVFFPLLIWWIIIYRLKKEKWDISANTWITAAAVSLIAAPLFVILFYYAYTGALGIHSLVVDILLVFICSFLALAIAAHLLRYARPGKAAAAVLVTVIILLIAAFVYFTFSPPELPVFLDSVTGTYGIQ